MANVKLRQRIAWEAARLLFHRQESLYFRARTVAAQRLSIERVHRRDLPTKREILDQVEAFARLRHQERLEQEDSLYGGDSATRAFVEPLAEIDRFEVYRRLLEPLERVKQKPEYHPEGDALYHSLQVFDLAREALSYDEEFLLAALLHDVGKGIDLQDHIGAALESLDGHITERTAWLIEHHSDVGALRDGTLGARSRRRLEESEDFDELMLLGRCDREGRRVGVATSDIEDALEYVRELARSCDE